MRSESTGASTLLPMKQAGLPDPSSFTKYRTGPCRSTTRSPTRQRSSAKQSSAAWPKASICSPRRDPLQSRITSCPAGLFTSIGSSNHDARQGVGLLPLRYGHHLCSGSGRRLLRNDRARLDRPRRARDDSLSPRLDSAQGLRPRRQGSDPVRSCCFGQRRLVDWSNNYVHD